MKITNLNAGTINQMADKIENKNVVFNSIVSEKEFFDYFSKETDNIKSSIAKLESENNEEKEEAISYLGQIKEFYLEHKSTIQK